MLPGGGVCDPISILPSAGKDDDQPPGRRGNVTATEDDGGIELTRSEIEKIFAPGPQPPAAARIVPSAERTMGWSRRSRPMRSAEEISVLPPNPPLIQAGEERDSDKRTMGVVDPPSDLMDLRPV